MRLFLRYIILLISLAVSVFVSATHNRAGEITYRLISGYTFEVTITTYTYSLSQANRTELTIDWGDNTSSIVPLATRNELPDYYYHSTYVAKHTFPGPGNYTLVMEDPNRNEGIVNIPNSVNTVFSVKSTLSINPLVGANNTPILTSPPVDKAAVGVVFVHNPGAYDPDGDSLSYKLTTCTAEGGAPISNYTLPKYSDSLLVNPVTGDLIWDAPVETGNYNVAILVEEWRKGVKIGSVVRDLQITVINTNNKPPVNPPIPDFCVIAGNTISFDFTVTDPDNNEVSVRATGAPFEASVLTSRAKLNILSMTNGATKAHFEWKTNCSAVRKLPWNVLLKSKDSVVTVVTNGGGYDTITQSLADIDNFSISVVAPPPLLKSVSAINNTAFLSWQSDSCSGVKGFYIYRRQDKFPYETDSCKGGVTKESGFVLVGDTGKTATLFTDNNNGAGLFQGAEYCYVVVAYFADGSLSIPSNEICVTIKPGMPSILNVSVTKDDENDGAIYLAWSRPRVDTIPGVTGPYTYKIYRSDLNIDGSNLLQIGTFTTSSLDDTTYMDTLNTVVFPYSYRIEMYDGSNNKVGEKQELASSLYPSISADNHKLFIKMVKNTPWSNYQYVVYRKNDLTSSYDSIGVTATTLFVDSNLINGRNYCYRIKSIGSRKLDNVLHTVVNYSHIGCGIPQDTVPPCQPVVKLTSNCDSFYISLNWNKQACGLDAVKYNIYFSPDMKSQPSMIYEITDPDSLNWIHYFTTDNIKGCYYVTATDSFNNESRVSQRYCTDECFEYELPNFFSPNGDGIGDYFEPIHKTFVRQIDIKIYSRWGLLVYQSNDPDIKWDGRYMKTGELLAGGVYYYICTVYEDRLSGESQRTLYGFIQLWNRTGDVIENQPGKE